MTRPSVAVLLACLAGTVATHAGGAPQAWTLDRLMTPAELQATGLSGTEVDPVCSWVYDYAWEIFGVARGESADGELSKTWAA